MLLCWGKSDSISSTTLLLLLPKLKELILLILPIPIQWFPNLTRAYGNNGRRPRQKFVFGILQLSYQYNKNYKDGHQFPARNIKFFKIILVTPSLGSTETLKAILRSVSSSVYKRLLMSLFSTTLTIATHFMMASHRHAFPLSSQSCSQTHFPSPSLLSYRYLND